jgi:hypothetical protein
MFSTSFTDDKFIGRSLVEFLGSPNCQLVTILLGGKLYSDTGTPARRK